MEDKGEVLIGNSPVNEKQGVSLENRKELHIQKQPKHDKGGNKEKLVILITSTLCGVLVGMNWIAFPIFYVEFSEYFGSSKWIVGGVGSLQIALSQILGIVTSAPIEVYGCRPVTILGGLLMAAGFITSAFAPNITVLYLTYGVVGGIGWSFANLPSHVILQQHFDKNRSLATTFGMMGRSFGHLIGPLILEYFIMEFGWRGTLALYGAIMLNASALAISYYTPKSLKHTKKKGIKAILKAIADFSIFKDITFSLFCLSIFFMKFNVNGVYHHLPSRMVFYGTSKLAAAWLLTIAAACSIVFRLVAGIIGNHQAADKTVMFAVSVLMGGLVTVLLPVIDVYIVTAVFAGIFGGSRGAAMLVINLALVDQFGVKKYARSKGLLNVFGGIAGLLATPFSGWIFDVTQNYDIPFYVCGTIGLLSGLIASLVIVINRNKSRNEDSGITTKT